MNEYDTTNIITKYLDTEHDISCVYKLLGQCKITNDKDGYIYLKEELEKLLKIEKELLLDEEFNFYLLIIYGNISQTYRYTLNELIKEKEIIARLNEFHMIMERIEYLNIGLDMQNNKTRIVSAFKEDLVKQELLLTKKLIENETDEARKNDLIIMYYFLISCSPKLEKQFLIDEKLLDISENNLLEIKKLYPIDYEVFNKLNYLAINIYNGINDFLSSYTEKGMQDENIRFYFNLTEMKVRNCITALSNSEYLDLKNSIFKDLMSINSEGTNKVKEIFAYRNKDKGNSKILGLYTSRNIK